MEMKPSATTPERYPGKAAAKRRSRWSRRQFVATMAAGVAAGGLTGPVAGVGTTPSVHAAPPRRKKIALLASIVHKYSHAQHFIDRFLEGYGWHGRHHYPQVDLVSLYVDQFPDGDLSRDREQRHRARIFPSVSEALTLGGSKLAVDGVVIIAEHGSYKVNDKGQKLYPRHKFFKECVRVFEDSGRSVPVFQDKHLSTEWDECVEQVEDSRRLGFAYLAGSSLPVTWRFPEVEIEMGTAMQESVSVCYGGVDSYDIHGLESAQCMSERRAGGESGVKSVHAIRGAEAWVELEQQPTTRQLMEAALARSHSILPKPGYAIGPPTFEWAREAKHDPIVYFVEHRDGFRTTLIMLHHFVQDFNYAGKLQDDTIVSCQNYLPMPPRHTTLADFFNPLVNNIEQMILTGKAPYKVERTLLMSGVTLFGIESLYRGNVKLLTPELDVAYEPLAPSTFWRA